MRAPSIHHTCEHALDCLRTTCPRLCSSTCPSCRPGAAACPCCKCSASCGLVELLVSSQTFLARWPFALKRAAAVHFSDHVVAEAGPGVCPTWLTVAALRLRWGKEGSSSSYLHQVTSLMASSHTVFHCRSGLKFDTWPSFLARSWFATAARNSVSICSSLILVSA